MSRPEVSDRGAKLDARRLAWSRIVAATPTGRQRDAAVLACEVADAILAHLRDQGPVPS